MSAIESSSEINQPRRHFLGTTVAALGVAQLGLLASASAKPLAAIKPGTRRVFSWNSSPPLSTPSSRVPLTWYPSGEERGGS